MSSRSGLVVRVIRGNGFKVFADQLSCLPIVACKAVLMLGGEEAGTGWLVGDLQP